MKLIKPSYSILESQGYLKDIEIAARNCYKSENKITDTSAQEMVLKLIKMGHTAMLEHGTVYLKVGQYDWNTRWGNHFEDYFENPYSIEVYDEGYYYITTNYRELIKNNWLEDLKYQCEPTKFHEKRISVRFICDRGVSHEFVRHRVFSFAQESTRYCNYTKDKFSNEITFIKPCWDFNGNEEMYYVNALETCETEYFQLIAKGWKPQQARSVLPNSLKTELIMTGFVSDWKGFFKLRDSASAHPQARELAQPLEQEFFKLGLL